MPPNRAVLITGANRGIGFAILQALALRSPSDHYLLGCRDLLKGEAAIQELRKLGITSPIEPIQIDVTSDDSLRAAVQTVDSKFGCLDVLVNNAGAAVIPSAPDFSDYRSAFSAVYDTNVTSVAITTQLFLPLLRKSPSGIVINVSSGRGSLGISSSGKMPPTASIPYSISKTALNALTLEMAKFPENQDVQFQVVGPGHCKTEFNRYRGTRDPLEGANVVVELVNAEKGRVPNAGFWQTEGASKELVRIPW
jgi:NAD(P)-dependent dehydrogenase (short-subunit alcohol dehydrogenase family)